MFNSKVTNHHGNKDEKENEIIDRMDYMLKKPCLGKQVSDTMKGKLKNVLANKDNFASTRECINDETIKTMLYLSKVTWMSIVNKVRLILPFLNESGASFYPMWSWNQRHNASLNESKRNAMTDFHPKKPYHQGWNHTYLHPKLKSQHVVIACVVLMQ